jgi:release factor glutamine methyltransferase
MTLMQALQHYATVLGYNGVTDSRLEARLLISHVTQKSAVEIYTEPEQRLSQADKQNLKALVQRRLRREPPAYILNHREFYGNDFYVDPRVLIPRPETELLVDLALAFGRSQDKESSDPLTIADIGTGCGAIAISLALNLPQSRIFATDISSLALEVAELNCQRDAVNGQVTLLQGDLLEQLPERVDLIVANLPYIEESEIENLDPEISAYEPRIALDGGRDGLYHIGRLLAQVNRKIRPRGCVLLEFGQGQQDSISYLVRRHLDPAGLEFISDLNGIYRVVQINF